MKKVEVSKEICKACLFCIRVCPKKILKQGEDLNKKGHRYVITDNPENCISCRQCADICPDAAITLYK